MIVLGKIIEPYGIAGWVRVHPFADDVSAWAKLPELWLSRTDDVASESDWQARRVVKARASNGKLLAQLAGVDDRNASEALKGWFVGAPREALPVPAAGEFYWHDLIGLEVVNLDGEMLGVVAEMIATGANDVLAVRRGDTQCLIPFLDHVIKNVDLAGKKIQVDWGVDW